MPKTKFDLIRSLASGPKTLKHIAKLNRGRVSKATIYRRALILEKENKIFLLPLRHGARFELLACLPGQLEQAIQMTGYAPMDYNPVQGNDICPLVLISRAGSRCLKESCTFYDSSIKNCLIRMGLENLSSRKL